MEDLPAPGGPDRKINFPEDQSGEGAEEGAGKGAGD